MLHIYIGIWNDSMGVDMCMVCVHVYMVCVLVQSSFQAVPLMCQNLYKITKFCF